mmetsp:Transcript_9317/g.34474  ORF Transcript_9317/g.34474 Transcript_9317/m.34474 type:complete len:320 (-) Transcript_9317:1656-2615(-)
MSQQIAAVSTNNSSENGHAEKKSNRSESGKKNKHNFKHALAGGISGTAISLTLQPLDVVKTRMIGTRTKSNTSFMAALKETARNDGIRGLWSGSVPTVLRVLPGGFIYFGGIHAMQGIFSDGRHLEDAQTWKDHGTNFLIGASARTLAGTVTCPILVVKTRFEFSAKDDALRTKSTFGTLKHIYQMEGMRGLFKGWSPTIARDVPYAGLFLVFYSQMKHLILTAAPSLHEHDSWVTLPSGAVAGGMSTILTHPFDVVRTRMQLNPKANGVIPTFSYLVREEGVSSLLRGVTSRVVKRSASSALSWALYERVAHFFTKEW